MVSLTANLTMLYTEHPFFERFDRAADDGFGSVEFFFPYGLDHDRIAEALRRNRLELALFNLPLGDWDAGERGFAAQDGRQGEFAVGLAAAVESVAALHPSLVNTPSGPAPHTEAAFEILTANVRTAAEALGAAGAGMVLEPINRHDVPGALVSTVARAAELLAAVAHPNLGIQYDLYHSLRAGEDPYQVLAEYLPLVRHVQIADVPGRHQPGTGDVDFERLFSALDDGGYTGRVSLEYHPEGATSASLDRLRQLQLLEPRRPSTRIL